MNTWTRRIGRAPRAAVFTGHPLGRLHITFNLPQSNRRPAMAYRNRRWDTSNPTLTGELLLAALKENA